MLEAVVTSNWGALDTAARDLEALTNDPRWAVLKAPEYARQSASFRQAIQELRQAAAQPDQPEVHIRPNKLVEYRSVAAVLASAQRLGVTKLGMIGNEQFVK